MPKSANFLQSKGRRGGVNVTLVLLSSINNLEILPFHLTCWERATVYCYPGWFIFLSFANLSDELLLKLTTLSVREEPLLWVCEEEGGGGCCAGSWFLTLALLTHHVLASRMAPCKQRKRQHTIVKYVLYLLTSAGYALLSSVCSDPWLSTDPQWRWYCTVV